MQASVRRAF